MINIFDAIGTAVIIYVIFGIVAVFGFLRDKELLETYDESSRFIKELIVLGIILFWFPLIFAAMFDDSE